MSATQAAQYHFALLMSFVPAVNASLSPAPNSPAGVVLSLVASVLFATMYYYATLLEPLGGEQIFGWRILLTAPLLTVLILVTGQSHQLVTLWRRLRAQPALWLVMPVSAALLGVQLWLFLWAPINGYALDVSLGYFLLPLTLVLTGRWVFGERLSRWQQVACGLAAIGVLNELLFAPRVAWPAFVVALGYPVYFALRRHLRTPPLAGMWLDMLLCAPLGLAFVVWAPEAARLAGGTAWLLILGLGALSATSLACMIASTARLSLGLFGLLSYAEPVLLVVVALVLGERIAPAQWPTYIAIWTAILVLLAAGMRDVRRRLRTPVPRGSTGAQAASATPAPPA